MNNVYQGKTPVEIPFTWYWYYDFELKREGYQAMWARERFRSPVYLWMPFDLVAEAMPFPIYDTKRRHYVLVSESENESAGSEANATP